MGGFLAVIVVASTAFVQVSTAGPRPEQNASAQPASRTESSPADLPALPQGKSTVIGGTISSVDPITDELTLKVFGAGPMKVFYDERTQVYRDGTKVSLRDLHANDRASVETMLDGTSVFARSIHMLSQSPKGECQGQIVNYDLSTRELTVSDSLSREALKLRVPEGTAIVREGQAASASGGAASSDLVKGTLISAEFDPDNKGEGVASRIAILAKPGSAFTFSGDVASLDMHARQFVVVDPLEDKRYKISFDPAVFPAARNLHEGDKVRVTANFDGSRYVASAIAVNSEPKP